MDWTLWMTLAVIPALSAMFWWVWRVQAQLVELESQLLNQLADFKLDVAKNYASNFSLRETEARLVAHLNRIEAKLDRRREV
jgi:Na+-transporting NADH:ubiquinone oxidoreductase subunit NqrB